MHLVSFVNMAQYLVMFFGSIAGISTSYLKTAFQLADDLEYDFWAGKRDIRISLEKRIFDAAPELDW